VLRLRPQDTAALIDFAHSSHALGQVEAAIEALRRVTEIEPGHIGALRSLVEMYRQLGQRAEALEAANAIAGQLPGDVVATLDMAELNLELGNFGAALAGYGRLVNIDLEPQHATYAYHGMIHTEIQRASWRRALTLTIDATRFDREELTTLLLAFVAARLFGDAGRPAPSQVDVEAALAAEHAEHRRAHLELIAET
jgi:tetratricopeptide (TPR) repeat protein